MPESKVCAAAARRGLRSLAKDLVDLSPVRGGLVGGGDKLAFFTAKPVFGQFVEIAFAIGAVGNAVKRCHKQHATSGPRRNFR
jgi:hypothetical protein